MNTNFSNFVVGEKVIIIENTYNGEVFEWQGIVTEVTEAYIETKHCRNAVTHPYWHSYMKAYSDTYTKHYSLKNIKQLK